MRWGNFFKSLGLLLSSASWAAESADAQRDFDRAQGLFEQGKESEALTSLTDFLRRHPDDNLADDAQLMIGEVEFHRRNFEVAAIEFRKVLEYRKNKGDKIPQAFLRAGDALLKLGRSEQALLEWEALRRTYPASPEARDALERIQGVPRP